MTLGFVCSTSVNLKWMLLLGISRINSPNKIVSLSPLQSFSPGWTQSVLSGSSLGTQTHSPFLLPSEVSAYPSWWWCWILRHSGPLTHLGFQVWMVERHFPFTPNLFSLFSGLLPVWSVSSRSELCDWRASQPLLLLLTDFSQLLLSFFSAGSASSLPLLSPCWMIPLLCDPSRTTSAISLCLETESLTRVISLKGWVTWQQCVFLKGLQCSVTMENRNRKWYICVKWLS